MWNLEKTEEKRQIVNIINFIRAVKARGRVALDEMLLSVRGQIDLMQKHNLRGTFLLQYDSLLQPAFTDMLKALDPNQFEFGVWLEIVQPQAEKCGIPWMGQYPWDWHVYCGFPMGYDNAQREQLADALFEKFKEVFGFYPRAFGSWMFDTHTIRYITEKYGLDAICNCKEQYGTDGYTLWGGYYGQGYYPSKTNIFMPAQTDTQQINVPIFRMLGSDHVYQYDLGVSLEDGADICQSVLTLEPACKKGGGNPKWVDWYLKENYNGECLSFGYAQAGQENSFGWWEMKDGLIDQFAKIARMQEEGKLTVEPLGDTGRWFKQCYRETPASAITAHDAWDDAQKNSVWYCTKNYRVNLYRDREGLRIRDLYFFDENMPDPYENVRCPSNSAAYETLPVIDGNRFTGHGIRAGLYVDGAAGYLPMTFCEADRDTAEVSYDECRFVLKPCGLNISGGSNLSLTVKIGKKEDAPEVLECTESRLTLQRFDRIYRIRLNKGHFDGVCRIVSENGTIEAVFENVSATCYEV